MTEGQLSPIVAIAIWWHANTVAHLFIHRPFFRRPGANAAFGAGLSLVLGFPQAVWRDRHLAHHAGRAWRFRVSGEVAIQSLIVAAGWSALAAAAPHFFVAAYLPGYAGALALCALHGHYEHAGGTTSHYGRLYNALCFNDGFHVEHHRHPGVPWRQLPSIRAADAKTSAWPAPLRWLQRITTAEAEDAEPAFLRRARSLRLRTLTALERVVLRSRRLQTLVLRRHARAIREVLASIPPPRRVTIVGGGLFPRTALILRELCPGARLTIVDADRAHLDRAREFLGGDEAVFVHGRYDADCGAGADLVVFPLAYDGDRREIYDRRAESPVLVHDWIWRRRGSSRVVSIALLKRVNLVA